MLYNISQIRSQQKYEVKSSIKSISLSLSLSLSPLPLSHTHFDQVFNREMDFGIKLCLVLCVRNLGRRNRRPEGRSSKWRASTWLLSFRMQRAFRTTRLSYNTLSPSCLTPTILLQTFTTRSSTLLFFTHRLPNQQMKEKVRTDSTKEE